jgi:type I restriction enzyme S subunit
LAEDGGFFGRFENSAYLMSGKFWVNNHAHVLKAREGVSVNRFILAWLIFDDISRYISGTTRQKLNQSVMRNILIPLPPLSEQKRIAEILSQIDQAIEKEEKYKQKLERLKKGLMEDLLTGKVRVNKLVEGESHEMA